MKVSILDHDALAAIPPRSLRSYVLFEGWYHVGAFGEYSEVFAKISEDGSSAEIIVPVTSDIIDYAFVVGEIIKHLSKLEGRNELEIYADLMNAKHDVIRVRAPDSDEYGAIAVGAGVEIMRYSRDLLASAACAALEPRKAYHLKKVVKAQEYMRKVRLGQTERGSFVVNIMAPVPPELEFKTQFSLWPDLDEEPYERRVTRFLVGALEAARKAITHSNRGAGLDAFMEAVPYGVSANLCEAVASIIEEAEEANLSVTWARTRPAPEKRAKIRFRGADASILKEVAREMRLQEPRRDEYLIGYVTNLRRNEDEGSGRATIKTFVDGKVRSLMAFLSEKDYDAAINAHKKQCPVSLVGDIEFEKQRWRLTDIRNLNIIDDSDEASTDLDDLGKLPD